MLRPLTIVERSHARAALNGLVGSPFRKKAIEDGQQGLKCPTCGDSNTPEVSIITDVVRCGNKRCGAVLWQPQR